MDAEKLLLAVRRVKTPEGADLFDQPIGSVIRKDLDFHLPTVPRDAFKPEPVKKAPAKRVSPVKTVAKAVKTPGTKQDKSQPKIQPSYSPGDAAQRKAALVPPAYTDFEINTNTDHPMIGRAKDPLGEWHHYYPDWYKEQQHADKYLRNKRLLDHMDKLDDRLKKDAETSDTALAVWLIRASGLRNGSPLDKKKLDANAKARREYNKRKRAGEDLPPFEPPYSEAYGASNMLASHIQILASGTFRIKMRGKSGHALDILVKGHPELGKMLAARKAAKGRNDRLFDTEDSKNNEYFKSITGDEFKIKDLRTLKAATIARTLVAKQKRKPKTLAEFKRRRNTVGDAVALALGHSTRSMSLNNYIDPLIFEPWRDPKWSEK